MAALRRRRDEESLVKGFTDTAPSPGGINANEVAVDLARVRLRPESG